MSEWKTDIWTWIILSPNINEVIPKKTANLLQRNIFVTENFNVLWLWILNALPTSIPFKLTVILHLKYGQNISKYHPYNLEFRQKLINKQNIQ